VQAEGHQNGLVALAAEVFEGKVAAQPRMEKQFRAKVEDFANLCLQDVARQAVFRNAEVHHAARHGSSLENGNRIAE